jgi:tetratricopeptide (TPR) repeat protein
MHRQKARNGRFCRSRQNNGKVRGVPIDKETTLKKFIAAKPADPFPRYALALEYMNGDRLEECVAAFGELVTVAPDYVATYLQYGGALVKLGRAAEARKVFEQGVDRARAKGDMHALAEIEGALGAL